MKILKLDEDNGIARVEPTCLEDLWYLSMIIRPPCAVEGRSFRRIKEADEGDRAKSGEKKPVMVSVQAEQVEFSESANKLRITGKIISGEPAEYVQAGSYHTIDIEMGHPVTLRKQVDAYDLELLEEAKRSSRHARVALAAIDDRKATLSALSSSGVKHVAEFESGASKKDPKAFEGSKKSFYHEILSALEAGEYESIVVAGPGFAKDEFAKYAKEKSPGVSEKIRIEHASTAERSAAYELLKRGALERIADEQRVQSEYGALEELKRSLGKDDGMSCYGLEEVAKAVESSAASTLLVLDELARSNKKVSELMRLARHSKVKILIFNSQDDAGAEFKTFGIAAMLRYNSKWSGQ